MNITRFTLLLTRFALLWFSLQRDSINSAQVDEDGSLSENINETTLDLRAAYHDNKNFQSKLCVFLNLSATDCSCDLIPDLCYVKKMVASYQVDRQQRKYRRSNLVTMLHASLTVIASLVGLIANFAVLLIAYRYRQKLSACKLHIAELAIINLVSSTLQIINAVPLYWTNTWLYGVFMCKSLRSLLEIGSFLSIGFIQIIAIERFQLVTSPLNSLIKRDRFKHVLVILNVAVALVTAIPYYYSLGIEEHSGRCIVFHNHRDYILLPYNIFVIFLYSSLPIFILTFITIRIISHLFLSKDTIIASEHNNNSIARRNRHIMYITLILLLFFVLCTLPTRAITLFIEMKGHGSIELEDYFVLTLVSYFTYPLQNTLNPILYSMTAKDWRKEMKTTFSRQKAVSIKETML